MAVNSGKCPYCARRRGECWILPCMELEKALASGVGSVRKWAGKNFIVTLNHPAKGGHARAT